MAADSSEKGAVAANGSEKGAVQQTAVRRVQWPQRPTASRGHTALSSVWAAALTWGCQPQDEPDSHALTVRAGISPSSFLQKQGHKTFPRAQVCVHLSSGAAGCPIRLRALTPSSPNLHPPPPAAFSSEHAKGYLAEEDVHRKGTPRDVKNGYIPKKGSKLFCIHSS